MNAPLAMVSSDAVNPITRELRNTHSATAGWLSTTQYWAWKGGDAIVVVTGYLPDVRTYVVLRQGTDVRVIEANGLNAAFRQLGIDPNQFTIVEKLS